MTAVHDADVGVTELFRAHHLRLLRLAVMLVDDEQSAEDVVQDAFVGLHRRWRSLHDPAKALPYLRSAVFNGARSQLRRRRTERSFTSSLVDLPSAESTAVVREDHREVFAGVAALPQRQREVLVCRYYLDMAEAEIAEVLGISRGSVKSHASRGLAALTARMEAAR